MTDSRGQARLPGPTPATMPPCDWSIAQHGALLLVRYRGQCHLRERVGVSFDGDMTGIGTPEN